MPPYVPKNIPVFQAALAGALSGMGVNASAGGNATEEDFDELSPIAGAFAQALDLAWFATSRAPNQFDIEAITSACNDAWLGRQPANNPVTLLAITYMAECVTIVNLILAGEDYFASQGITPTPISGGGGGVTAVTASLPILSSGGTTPNISLEDGTANSQVLVWSETDGEWQIRQLTQDDILPGFAIDSFTVSGGPTVEVGTTITNPTISASYNQLPASAHVTNTDGIDSPLTLITPFTAGTVVGAFTHDAPATASFTLTAVSTSGVTKTAGAALNWLYRTFAGVGTAGATSATASGTSAVLNGGAGTLPNAGLFGSIIGQIFNLSPVSQSIYIVTPDTGSLITMWKDNNTGLPFAMNAGITFPFTNAEGVTSTYVVYQSTNPLSALFAVEAVS